MSVFKPIKVSPGGYITDSDFNPEMFTYEQAVKWADGYRKRLQKQMKCKLKLKGVRDCGLYWTFTIG